MQSYILPHRYSHTVLSGDTFGNTDTWTGLGVFIDTYDNSDRTTVSMNRQQHPYVYAFVNDGSVKYNHNEHVNGGCHAGKYE